MKANTRLKRFSVLLAICIASAGLPRAARASENGVDAKQTAYIVVGAMVSIWIVGSLINVVFDHDDAKTQVEPEASAQDMGYDLTDDVSLSVNLTILHPQSFDNVYESTSTDSIQPTLILSMRF